MPIKVVCPQCGHSLSAPDHFAGKVAGCPACKTKIQVPLANGMPAQAVPTRPAAPVARAAAPAAIPRPTPAKPAGAPMAARPPVPPPPRPAGPPRPPAAPPPFAAAPPAAGDLPFSLGDSPTDAGSYNAGGFDSGFAFPDLTSGTPSGPPPRPGAQPIVKKKKSNVMLYSILGGSALALVLAGVVAWMYLGGGGGGASFAAAQRYLPDNPVMVMRVNVHEVLKSGAIQKFRAQHPDIDALLKGGATGQANPDEINDIVIGFCTPKTFAGVMRFWQPINADNLAEENILPNNGIAVIIDDHTVLIGDSVTVAKVRKRAGRTALSTNLEAAIGEANLNSAICMVIDGKAVMSGAGARIPTGIPIDTTKLSAIIVEADVNSSIDVRAVAAFKDATAAQQIKGLADAALPALQGGQGLPPGMPPALLDVLKTISVSQSGSTVKARMSISSGAIEALMQMVPNMPTGGGGAPF